MRAGEPSPYRGYVGFRVSQNKGYIFGGDYSILGVYIGSPI